MSKNWRIYQNYIIIALLSIVSVFFLPLLGSSAGLGFIIPNTAAGWTVYIATKFCIVVINILIFDQFVKQAKINIKDDPRFVEAEEILNNTDTKDEPILPAKYYLRKMYKSKMSTSAIMTLLGVFGFTNALLTFDWVAMLSYLFTISIGIVFGWISMNQAEEIWTERHYRYAKKVERDAKEALEDAAKKLPEQIDDTSDNPRGTDILEPIDSDGVSGDSGESLVLDSIC